jgi:hypothetical protein
VGNELLTATPNGTEVHALSGGAALIWAGLDVPRGRADLIEHLARGSGIEPAAISVDVDRSLETLVELGLLDPSGGEPHG